HAGTSAEKFPAAVPNEQAVEVLEQLAGGRCLPHRRCARHFRSSLRSLAITHSLEPPYGARYSILPRTSAKSGPNSNSRHRAPCLLFGSIYRACGIPSQKRTFARKITGKGMSSTRA